MNSLVDSILSLDEARALGKPVPYSYVLGHERQKIFVLGAAHFKPADDQQFTLMRELWAEFTALPTPKVAFIEDSMPPAEQTFHEAAQRGEGCATRWLADKEKIPVIVADLDLKECTLALNKKFDLGKIAYYFIAYTMWNYARRGKDANLEEVIHGNRALFESMGLNMDMGWFNTEHEVLFPGQIPNLEFWQKSMSLPLMKEMIVESARVRNIRVIGLSQEYWSKGYSIFIVYGANHSWELEPALRKLVVSKELS